VHLWRGSWSKERSSSRSPEHWHGQPEAQISHDGQVLTLRRSDSRRVLVYRIELTSLFWMVLLPDNTHQCTFSGIDQSLGFDRLADRLQEALK
jgi:hypothetical protein